MDSESPETIEASTRRSGVVDNSVRTGLLVNAGQVRSPDRILSFGGYLFLMASFLGLFLLSWQLYQDSASEWGGEGQFSEWALSTFGGPLIGLLTSIFAAVFGYRMLKAAGAASRDVIPQRDRELLSEIILRDPNPMDQYVRLSSLAGVTGFFTKLGLTGLPLATLALATFLALLGVVSKDPAVANLAELTLGAFLGSFVQRTASRDSAPPKVSAATLTLPSARSQADHTENGKL